MPQSPTSNGHLPTTCERYGEHQGDTYPVEGIDGVTGWHWTCCDDIDTEET